MMAARDLHEKAPETGAPKTGLKQIVFYGLGAQKSGTTWLYRYFSLHKQAYTLSIKELDYFHALDTGALPNLLTARAKHLRQAIERAESEESTEASKRTIGDLGALIATSTGSISYDAMFSGRKPHHRAYGEISPRYAMLSTDGFAEMLRVNPEARFFFIMRDPIDRFWSAVRMLVSRNPARRAQYDSTKAAFLALLGNPDAQITKMTDYVGTMERLECVVPQDQIHYMFYEDLFSGDVARGEAALKELTDFIGLDFETPNLEEKVWSTSETIARVDELDDDMIAQARDVFDPIYRYLASRFGPRLPVDWRCTADMARGAR